MNRIALTLAALIATLAGPAQAGNGFPPSQESCNTLDESVGLAKQMASDHSVDVAFFDDDQAHLFLAQLIPAGSKLLIMADHVALFTYPAAESAIVSIANGACGGYGASFEIKAADMAAALKALGR